MEQSRQRGRLYRFFIGEQVSPEAKERVQKKREEHRARIEERRARYEEMYPMNAVRPRGNWLQRLLTPHGRAPRTTFLFLQLASLVALPVAYVVQLIPLFLPSSSALSLITWVLAGALFIGLLVVAFMVSIRRLHDMDYPSWVMLFGFIPVVGWFLWLMLLVGSGTDGPNKYGPQPNA